ncbi:MAG: hypothetical protein HY329_15500, partial [Chloroflexi bacterium]|nr:hypothetical protein [Chloroflexota bacterium]
MPRLEALSQVQRSSLESYPAQLNETTPWTPLPKPLDRCRVALVTTAGLHLRDDVPFASAETRFREFPSNATAAELLQSHPSANFDRSALQRDLDTSFPVDRLRELAADGKIGGLAPKAYSFIGALHRYQPLETESGPEVAQWLRADGADVVL